MELYSDDDAKRKKRKFHESIPLAPNPDVKAAAIVSTEGLPITSALPKGVDETRIAVMSASLNKLAKYSNNESENGDFDHICIKGSEGYLLIMQAGYNAILTVSTAKEVRLEQTILDLKRTCDRIADLI